MAKGFNLTAQINLRGPTNLKPIVADIKRQLGTIDGDVNFRISPSAGKSINNITKQLNIMSRALINAQSNANNLNNVLNNLSSTLSLSNSVSGRTTSSITGISKATASASKNIRQTSTEMEEFGKQSALAVRRFAAFSSATTVIYGLINAINSGFQAFIDFDKELVKSQQVTNKGATSIALIEKTITDLAINLVS